MPLSVGAGISGAFAGSSANEPKSKNDLQDTITRLERQRDDYEKQRAQNADSAADKKIKNLEDRINNLRSRMDKMKAEDENVECETCKNRKYQDGSDDPGVSFKSASKISGNAEAAVRGHEQEHVSRNRAKADREGKEIVYQSVVIKHAICPECGTNYVSGGETTTVTRTKPDNDNDFEISAGNSDDKNGDENVFGVSGKDNESGKAGGVKGIGKDHDYPGDDGDQGERVTRQDERFSVGLYDREQEIGKFLNIVA
ncbi:MAG: hypothetical protein K2N56_09710 [Oscillospiraceae bacterium]|nr:hypothetical protein [Oscillospiraceae bacterium]